MKKCINIVEILTSLRDKEAKKNYLYLVRSDSSSSTTGKLKDGRSCSTHNVSPADWVNVGCLGVSVARVLLTSKASVFRIIELYHKSLWLALSSLFYVNQHSSAAVGQPIQGINVMDKDDVTPNLQLQHSLEGSIPDAASVVDLERFDEPACILGFDGEEFSVDLIQLSIVPGVDFGVCAVDVEGIGVDDGSI